MSVTVVGAGNMGCGIATRVLAAGHEVENVDRDAEQACTLAEELGGSATALEPNHPLGGDVVVFAVYYRGTKDAVREYADRVDVGPLRRARRLEQVGFLHIAIQQPLDLGFASAIKLHR